MFNKIDKLVTVTVIAYHSEKTIIETLDSILNQTYDIKNIEVIISDDGSSDNTLFLASEWQKLHLDKFHSVHIVSHDKNQGVVANCNQAWRLARGHWIKTIAADDLLLPECIEINVNYIAEHPCTKLLFSNMISFTKSGQKKIIKHNVQKISCGREKQYENILRECYLLAPTSFINKNVLVDVDFGDQTYPMVEDYPLWLRCLDNGYKFDYLNAETVLYRIGDSLSQQGTKIGNVLYLKSLYLFQKEKIWPQLPPNLFLKKWDDTVLYYQRIYWIKLFGNNMSVYYKIFVFLLLLFRPYRLFSFFRKKH
ncbi:glycosyltransferase [Aeromonas jandaei]|uniref:glycosyltransferase n=1 Tax=Aeromonas jandaei TaxID=650 RepID=UPI001ADD919C|nr:glycosyltransferase [Aeromonas jandaei]QTL92800.1 UDP-Glc:alpha-D-GlcNAc-diphosphoundecaprenol beta-1,3-glucosyltransferase WfgD [Aeromonas jandaei]